MKKIRTTIYISEDIYQKVLDIVHKEKQQGNRAASQSEVISRGIESLSQSRCRDCLLTDMGKTTIDIIKNNWSDKKVIQNKE